MASVPVALVNLTAILILLITILINQLYHGFLFHSRVYAGGGGPNDHLIQHFRTQQQREEPGLTINRDGRKHRQHEEWVHEFTDSTIDGEQRSTMKTTATRAADKTSTRNVSTRDVNNNVDKSNDDGFAACLMLKDDNDLLYEWLAYHYTVLPLRYVVIGSDVNQTQDPEPVLRRWSMWWNNANVIESKSLGDHHPHENLIHNVKRTPLSYWVLQPDDFVHRHDDAAITSSSQKNANTKAQQLHQSHHHHALINRQKGFLTTCIELLKREADNVTWTLFTDSDEYIVMNRVDPNRELLPIVPDYSNASNGKAISQRDYDARMNLPPIESNATVMDVLRGKNFRADGSATCITMPRLLVGAREDKKCSETEAILHEVKANYPYAFMSTMRFVQHAPKGDFSYSKFGKVMMDLSRLSLDDISSQPPRNIHRPYIRHCGPGVVPFHRSMFYLNHYLGSWERYSGRQHDGRRHRAAWDLRQGVDAGTNCGQHNIQYWLTRFQQIVDTKGGPRYYSQYLLGYYR